MLFFKGLRKRHQFTGTSIPGDLTDTLTPLHTLEYHHRTAHVEMTNVHYVNVVNPGKMRQTGDPPTSSRIVESQVTQHMSGLNDGYITPLDVGVQTIETIYQNSQPVDGCYVTTIDHYSTID